MTGSQLQQALNRMELTQAAFAEMVGMATETVNRWCNDKKPIPKWAALVVTLMLQRQQALILERVRVATARISLGLPATS